jgi:uncharacterized protein YbaR (Trm112 family)
MSEVSCRRCYGRGKLYSPVPSKDSEPTYICPECKGKKTVDIVKVQREEIAELQAENAELQANYNELLYQVQNKIPGESRHETAKRIINQHENKEAQCNSNIAKNTMTQK